MPSSWPAPQTYGNACLTGAPCLIPFAGLSRPAEGKALRSRGNHPKVRKDRRERCQLLRSGGNH
jgi:hypothetical protein